MKTVQEIQNSLDQFCGTQQYHRFSILFRNILLTDGAKYLADNAECYWLFDILGSVINMSKIKSQDFLVVKFSKGCPNLITIEDGNSNVLYQQEIVYTDFPFHAYSFFVQYASGNWICLLRSEY